MAITAEEFNRIFLEEVNKQMEKFPSAEECRQETLDRSNRLIAAVIHEYMTYKEIKSFRIQVLGEN